MIFDLSRLGLGISLDMLAWLSEHVGYLNTGRTKIEGSDFAMVGSGWHITYDKWRPMIEIDDDTKALLFKLTWL